MELESMEEFESRMDIERTAKDIYTKILSSVISRIFIIVTTLVKNLLIDKLCLFMPEIDLFLSLGNI
jgi:hypothetical protein